MPELIRQGNIYLSMPPLYKIVKGKNHQYLLDDSELQQYKAKHGGENYDVYRFKGLGEMSSEELKETTMDTSKRRLKQLTIQDEKDVALMFNNLMGTSVTPRKEFVSSNAYKANIVI